MNMKRTGQKTDMASIRQGDVGRLAIVSGAALALIIVRNLLWNTMMVPFKKHEPSTNPVFVGEVAATNTSAHWLPVDVKRGYVAGSPGSNWFHYVSNEREESKGLTAWCIKLLMEQEDTRMTRIHARLALRAMEYAIRSGREGELVGIIGDFLAKGLKEEGAK